MKKKNESKTKFAQSYLKVYFYNCMKLNLVQFVLSLALSLASIFSQEHEQTSTWQGSEKKKGINGLDLRNLISCIDVAGLVSLSIGH